jgi:hypothetical protein
MKPFFLLAVQQQHHSDAIPIWPDRFFKVKLRSETDQIYSYQRHFADMDPHSKDRNTDSGERKKLRPKEKKDGS